MTRLNEQYPGYTAPETAIIDMIADHVLCSSTMQFGTERLNENEFNPWQ